MKKISKIYKKEITSENATKAHVTADNVYIIHTTQIRTNKYIEHDPSKPTITRMCKKG